MYLSTKRAAEILGVTVSTAHTLLHPADSKEKSTRGRWSNLYLTSRVYALQTKRQKGASNYPIRKDIYLNMKRCENCGTYFKHETNTKCKICTQGFDPADPHNVRIVSKKQQHRVCPTCGDSLWEGEQYCPRCSRRRLRTGIDPSLAYGSISHTRN